ncbi:Signal peptidase I V [Bacillus sp. THAF10]|uniref:signal peptidase I n=1 Tax=Bacillus sp. THAF10 TaxID=2587848 RepID=UPI001268AF8C|nr:signal peptidase I [Bacillus sp. THAF10]QFT88303.1 Signal peptidase I V [Bacillus sp. THAF10]
MKQKKKHLTALKWFITPILIIIFVRALFFSNYVVEGHSMNPTLEQGNFLMVNKMVYAFSQPERFDVIVFRQEGQDVNYVKRVIGLPGDEIEYIKDILYVNGQPVMEPFISSDDLKVFGGNFTGDFSLEELTGVEKVPKGHVFVIGDNRLSSFDSRHFGYVAVKDIVGKVHIRYWPVDDFNTTFK